LDGEKMITKAVKHRVRCAVCGRRGIIKIDNDGNILSNAWNYFGKHNINVFKTSKFFYRYEDGHFLDRKYRIKVENKEFDATVRPKFVEYWECKRCHADDEIEVNIGKGSIEIKIDNHSLLYIDLEDSEDKNKHEIVWTEYFNYSDLSIPDDVHGITGFNLEWYILPTWEYWKLNKKEE